MYIYMDVYLMCVCVCMDGLCMFVCTLLFGFVYI